MLLVVSADGSPAERGCHAWFCPGRAGGCQRPDGVTECSLVLRAGRPCVVPAWDGD